MKKIPKLMAHFDRNTAARCNSSLCILCRRNCCTGLLWNWAFPPDTDRCCKFYIGVFHRCRTSRRALAPGDRISARRSRYLHRRFSSTRSTSPTRPIHRRSGEVCPRSARIPGSGTTATKFEDVIKDESNSRVFRNRIIYTYIRSTYERLIQTGYVYIQRRSEWLVSLIFHTFVGN